MNKLYENNYKRILKRYNEENENGFESYDELAEEVYTEHIETEQQRMKNCNECVKLKQQKEIESDKDTTMITVKEPLIREHQNNPRRSININPIFNQQLNKIPRNSYNQRSNQSIINFSTRNHSYPIKNELYERNYKRMLKKYNEEYEQKFEAYDELSEDVYNENIEIEKQKMTIEREQQSNRSTVSFNNQQSNRSTITSNDQQSSRSTVSFNNQQSNRSTITSNDQQSSRSTVSFNNQQSNPLTRNDSIRTSTFHTFQSNRNFGNDQSLHLQNHLYDNSPRNSRYTNSINTNSFENPITLQRGDFMNDFEIDKRFPKDNNNHFIHHYTKRNNMNGMNHYVIEDKDEENGLKCLICLDEFKADEKAYKLRCSHIFHEDCFVIWREKHNSCPECRQKIDINENSGPSLSCVIC